VTKYRISGPEDLHPPEPFLLPIPKVPMVEYNADELKKDPKNVEKVIGAYTKSYTGDYLPDFRSADQLISNKLDYISSLEDEYLQKAIGCEQSEKELKEAQQTLKNRLE
jgi:hypothetical protein